MTYPNQSCQSHKSCSLPAIFPNFYKGQRCFGLDMICKLVYRKLQRVIGFWCRFQHLSNFVDNVFAFYIRDRVSLKRFLQKWYIYMQLAQVKAIQVLKKKKNAIQLRVYSGQQAGPVHKMPSIFSPVCISSNSWWGCNVYSSNPDPRPISHQCQLGMYNVRQFPSTIFCSQNIVHY